jgi:biopolymer transport protein ExbB
VVDATLAYLHQGGWVMWPLAGVCLVMWTLIVERWLVLRVRQRGDLDVAGTLAVCRGEQEPPRSQALRASLAASFAAARTGRARLDREILAQVARPLEQDLDVRHAAIAVLASVAPLLGLLGTVLGMIETFHVISDVGTGNARALAGGISVALVTTQTGLLVAIPGLLVASRLRGRAQTLRVRLAETTQLVDRDLARRGGESVADDGAGRGRRARGGNRRPPRRPLRRPADRSSGRAPGGAAGPPADATGGGS